MSGSSKNLGIRTTALDIRQRARMQVATERLERPSLNRPSRPITPRVDSRQMFGAHAGGQSDYLPHQRPNTAFKMDVATFKSGFKRAGSVPDTSMRATKGLGDTSSESSSFLVSKRASSSHSLQPRASMPRTPPTDWDWANNNRSRQQASQERGGADVLNLEGAASMIMAGEASSTKKGKRSRSKSRRNRGGGTSTLLDTGGHAISASLPPSDLSDSVNQLWEELLSNLKQNLKQIRSQALEAPVSVGGNKQATSTPGAAAAVAAAAAKVIGSTASEVHMAAEKIFAMSEDALGVGAGRGLSRSGGRNRSNGDSSGGKALGGPAADVDRVHKVRLKLVEILGPLMVGTDSLVLLRVARTLLRVCVNALRLGRLRTFQGTLLSTVKVLYKLGKDDGNDSLFLSEGVLGALMEVLGLGVERQGGHTGDNDMKNGAVGATGRAGWLFDQEVMLYASSTVKFLSGNSKNQSWLATQGRAIQILAPLFDMRANTTAAAAAAAAAGSSAARAERGKGPGRVVIPLTADDVAQVLEQLSEVLRNLSRMKYAKQFYENRIVERLCALIPVYRDHETLMYNVSRILGKFSLDSKCRAIINAQRAVNARHFLGLCEAYPGHNGMLVRLCFTLGNLTASNDDNQRLIAMQLGGIQKLSRLLHVKTKIFVDLVEQQLKAEEELAADTTGAEDDAIQEVSNVLVKLVRVLANLAIHTDVGPLILAESSVTRDVTLVLQSCSAGGRDEELLLNAVSTLTNLSFYENWDTNTAKRVHHRGCVFQSRLALLQELLPLATHDNDEVVAHALRVIGNLSRDSEVRQLAIKLKGLELLGLLLDKTDPEVVVTACGILVNFASDPELVPNFCSNDMALVRKLVQVVDEAVEANEVICDQIATNALKSLVNLQGHGVVLQQQDQHRLFKVLNPYFGEQSRLQNDDDDVEEDPELVFIAQALLKALELDPAAAREGDTDSGSVNVAPASTGDNVLEPL